MTKILCFFQERNKQMLFAIWPFLFSYPSMLGSMVMAGNPRGCTELSEDRRLCVDLQCLWTCTWISGSDGDGPQRTQRVTPPISSHVTRRKGTCHKSKEGDAVKASENIVSPLLHSRFTVGLFIGRKTGVSLRVAKASTVAMRDSSEISSGWSDHQFLVAQDRRPCRRTQPYVESTPSTKFSK